MKTNKNKTVITLILVTLVLFACTPEPQGIQTSSAVQVDQALKLLIEGVLIAFFTAGTIYIFEVVGWDLRQFAIPVAVSTSTFLVGLLQGWINAQPVELDPWIGLGLRILAALLVSFGTLRIFSKQPKTLLA